MIDNNVLRGFLIFEDATKKVVFILLQYAEGDRLFLVSEFSKHLHDYQIRMREAIKATKGFDEQSAKEEIMEKISDALHGSDATF